jgi:peroxiredoxin
VWERTYKAWKGRGVEFVGVGLLAGKEQSRAFVQRHSLTFPNGWDGQGTVAKAYNFTYQPYWAVINRDHQLVRSGFGPRNENELVTAIRSLTGQ